MKHFYLTILLVISALFANAQDCIDYYLNRCPRLEENNYYTVVPEGSKSILMKEGEEMELTFQIYQGKDYRISTCSDLFDGKVVLRIYDFDDPTLLLYDNEKNDMIQSFEFQVIESRKIKAVVTVKVDEKRKQMNTLLIEKIQRGCVGLMLESMITRK